MTRIHLSLLNVVLLVFAERNALQQKLAGNEKVDVVKVLQDKIAKLEKSTGSSRDVTLMSFSFSISSLLTLLYTDRRLEAHRATQGTKRKA